MKRLNQQMYVGLEHECLMSGVKLAARPSRILSSSTAKQRYPTFWRLEDRPQLRVFGVSDGDIDF